MSRYLLILNEKAGTYANEWSEDLESELISEYRDSGDELVVEKPSPEELTRAIERGAGAGYAAILIGGGDGTIATAAGTLIEHDTPLGVVPLGTVNLAARDFGMPLSVREAVLHARVAEVQATDVLKVGDRFCLCATIVGFYPWLARSAGEYHGPLWWFKSAKVMTRCLWAFSRFSPVTLDIASNGKRQTVRTRLAAFVPGAYDNVFGVLPRRQDLAAGHMTVYVSRHRSPWHMMQATAAYLVDKWDDDRFLTRMETDRLTLDHRRRRSLPVMIDGEVADLSLPIDLELRPQALQVLMGPRRDEERQS